MAAIVFEGNTRLTCKTASLSANDKNFGEFVQQVREGNSLSTHTGYISCDDRQFDFSHGWMLDEHTWTLLDFEAFRRSAARVKVCR
jgi:hypothetical protein